MWFFIGCIIGTLPKLWKQAGKFGRKKDHIEILIQSLIIAFITFVFLNRATTGALPQNFYTWIFAGALMGLVAIVPGISAANILIFFGLYTPMTIGIAAFDISIIIPLIIGGIVAIVVFSKLMAFALKRAYSGLFHAVIGFVIASTLVIIPLNFNYISVGGLVCLFAAVMGAAVSRGLCKLER
jgi:putative membrane protein